MWDQRDAPLHVLQNPSLGDALFAMNEPAMVVEPVDEMTARIELLEHWNRVLTHRLADVERRLAQVEAHTLLAYWQRFVRWIRGVWLWQ